VLDKKLQDVVHQFEHQSGAMERITGVVSRLGCMRRSLSGRP
jgi:hypothetical protein